MKLEIKRRTPNKVAPFINDWNVWEIPEKYWDSSVQNAIIHAYELGALHARDAISDELHQYKPEFNSPIDRVWKETT